MSNSTYREGENIFTLGEGDNTKPGDTICTMDTPPNKITHPWENCDPAAPPTRYAPVQAMLLGQARQHGSIPATQGNYSGMVEAVQNWELGTHLRKYANIMATSRGGQKEKIG
jgi:hypothetical protein